MRSEQITYARVRVGDDVKVVPEDRAERLAQEGAEILAKQTFVISEPESLSEGLELCDGNEKFATEYLIRGVRLAQQTWIRDFMLSEDFTPSDGVIDLRSVPPDGHNALTEVRERKRMSPEERVARDLAALTGKAVTPELVRQLLAKLTGAAA
jgi:hypothetical protein